MAEQSVDQLVELFSDKDRLKAYRNMRPVKMPEGVTNEGFHHDLPFEEISTIVSEMGKEFLSKLPESQRSCASWEHVGSTSIKGMPGTKMPDALLLLPSFPPTKEVVKAFLDLGYYFSMVAPLDPKDIWFVYIFTEGVLKYHKMMVHCVTADNNAAKMLLDTRDMCRTEAWAFEDYKSAKVEAAKEKTILGYKGAKGKNSKLIQMLREKHNMPEMNIPGLKK